MQGPAPLEYVKLHLFWQIAAGYPAQHLHVAFVPSDTPLECSHPAICRHAMHSVAQHAQCRAAPAVTQEAMAARRTADDEAYMLRHRALLVKRMSEYAQKLCVHIELAGAPGSFTHYVYV